MTCYVTQWMVNQVVYYFRMKALNSVMMT